MIRAPFTWVFRGHAFRVTPTCRPREPYLLVDSDGNAVILRRLAHDSVMLHATPLSGSWRASPFGLNTVLTDVGGETLELVDSFAQAGEHLVVQVAGQQAYLLDAP